MVGWRQVEREVQVAKMSRGSDRESMERLFAPTGLSVPLPGRVWLDRDERWIAWTAPLIGEPEADDRGILEAFVRLADAPGKSFLRFAQRYGPLQLCAEHSLPVGHSPISADSPAVCHSLQAQAIPVPNERGELEELPTEAVSVPAWRSVAREARAALAVAAQLHRNKPGRREDWECLLLGMLQRSMPETFGQRSLDSFRGLGDRDYEKRWLADVLDIWLSQADVRPCYSWWPDSARPEINLGGGGVFGAVVRHLVFAVAKVDGLALCSGCGEAYTPRRRPSSGRNSWCYKAECRKKAANREAKRRERARSKEVVG